VNDKKMAEGRIERTQPLLFSLDDAADVAIDEGTPVTEEYKATDSQFAGKILKVTVDVKEMGAGAKADAAKANAEAAKKMEAVKQDGKSWIVVSCQWPVVSPSRVID
jgi:arylsulfatase